MRRRIVLSLTGYCLFLAFVVLSPSSDVAWGAVRLVSTALETTGAPAGVTTPHRLEFALNALMVVPIAAGGLLLAPSSSWRDWTAWAFVVSGTVELLQGLLLPGRSATFSDVCANTLGALAGALIVSWRRLPRPTADAHEAQSAP